jgi:hypothetical protein
MYIPVRAIGWTVAFFVLFAVTPANAAVFRRRPAGSGASKLSLRKRLHVNTLITEPGTIEIDWSSLYSFTTDRFAMPSGVRYTPEGGNIIWGRTEYSVAFDTLTSANVGGSRDTQFSQALTFTATSVLHDGQKLDIALAPQAAVFLRDESGSRLGAVAIARYDTGRNSIGATAAWSGATHASPSNPAGTFDLGLGFGRQLSGSRFMEKLTPHLNAEWERSTGQGRTFFGFEGVEYQVTERLAFDLSAQQSAAQGTAPDHQLAFGFTLSLGRVR